MGSKNLRAIAVRGSHRRLKTADSQKLKELARWYAKGVKDNKGLSFLHEFGTSGGVLGSSNFGNLPTFNHQDCSFAGAERITGQELERIAGKGTRSCFGCAVACKRVVEGRSGRFEVTGEYGGPEYESIASLGSQLGLDDPIAVAQANELCNAFGLDTISTGVTIAWAIECFERKLISKEDTGGLELRWNDPDTVLELIGMITRREGFGDVLAEGCLRAARKMGRGTELYAMQIKGQELPAHEPRGKWAAGLGFAVSPTGADHLQAAHDVYFAQAVESTDDHWIRQEDLTQVGLLEPFPKEDLSPKKVRLFVYLQFIWALHDVLDWCLFTSKTEFRHMRLDHIVEAMRYITGWRTNLFELLKAGERAITMARAFNVREGFRRKDDTLPQRLFEPIRDGTLAGHYIDREEFEKALGLYYGMMGWNEEGRPNRAKLEELGVGWVGDMFGGKEL
jgi:aldehyde:ferredoxin oxidoreductase